jgi:hypothetical protein
MVDGLNTKNRQWRAAHQGPTSSAETAFYMYFKIPAKKPKGRDLIKYALKTDSYAKLGVG